MSSKSKKDRDANIWKKRANHLKGKCQKEKDTYASQIDQKLHPMIDGVAKLQTELEYYKKQHTVNKKQIEDLTEENNELRQNNKMLSLIMDDRTDICDRLNSIKDDHEALIKFRAETKKTLAELKRKHEEEVKVLQALLETEKEKFARQEFHNSQVVDLLVKRHKEEKNQMQQLHDENTSELTQKAYAARIKLKTAIGIYDKYIEKLEKKVEIRKHVTISAVKEREAERESSKYWIEGLYIQNTNLRDQNELKVKTVKELTDENDQMGKIINEQKAQHMELDRKCQRYFRALAFEKKMKATVEDELVSLKKKNADLKKALSKEKEEHRKTALDRHKVKTAHNKALSEKVSLEEQLCSTKKQTKIWIEKTNRLEKKERHFQEELYQCVLSFGKAFPHATHFREEEKVEFRDMFLNLKKKYVDGVEGIPFVGITKENLEKQLNSLRTTCKHLETALQAKKQELVSFQKKYNDMVKSFEHTLFKERQELVEPMNQIIKKAYDEEKEIGHLKSRMKDVQLELKLEKQKGQKLALLVHGSGMGRCYGATPTPSQIFPRIKPRPPLVQTKYTQVLPKHPGRRVGMPSPVYPPL
ncbi:unnamed protein product [Oreochromis niloticus]|nr:unnamed protein product [Mustela putorius furo]